AAAAGHQDDAVIVDVEAVEDGAAGQRQRGVVAGVDDAVGPAGVVVDGGAGDGVVVEVERDAVGDRDGGDADRGVGDGAGRRGHQHGAGAVDGAGADAGALERQRALDRQEIGGVVDQGVAVQRGGAAAAGHQDDAVIVDVEDVQDGAAGQRQRGVVADVDDAVGPAGVVVDGGAGDGVVVEVERDAVGDRGGGDADRGVGVGPAPRGHQEGAGAVDGAG